MGHRIFWSLLVGVVSLFFAFAGGVKFVSQWYVHSHHSYAEIDMALPLYVAVGLMVFIASATILVYSIIQRLHLLDEGRKDWKREMKRRGVKAAADDAR